MQIFIDSADLTEIQEAFSFGIVDGITTNPSLIKKAFLKAKAEKPGVSLRDVIVQILEAAGDCPVSLEVIGVTEDDMIREGFKLHELFSPIADNVVIKIPVNPNVQVGDKAAYDGLKAIRALASEGLRVNTTLIFTPEQALLAAKAGAAYVSPFAGRIDDLLRTTAGGAFDKTAYFPETGISSGSGERLHDNGIASGVQLIGECVEIFGQYDFECEVLAASLRNSRQVRECAIAGADVATIPLDIIRSMIEHKKTAEGMRAFIADVVPEYRALFG